MKLSDEKFHEALIETIGALLLAGLAAALLHSSSEARAQTPAARGNPPHIAFVYPAGGQAGTTVSVAVGGQNLVGPTAVYFSEPGLLAQIAGYERPLTQKEFNDLRDRLQQLQEKRAAKTPLTSEEMAEAARLREQLANRPNRQASPALAEAVRLEIAIPSDTKPGRHELRVRTAGGLSNPFVFQVGALPEFVAPPVLVTTNNPPRPERPNAPRVSVAATETRVAMPVVVNGQILPGEIDRVRFAGHRGEALDIAVQARALLPYLADAVPGWFQATLALKDVQGREVAYVDDDGCDPDPRLRVTLPSDGDYVLEIQDAICRGREDFVYRLTIAPALAAPIVASAPCTPRETLSLPAQVRGCVAHANETADYRFAGQEGQVVVAEVVARRAGSPLDSVLTLTDATGERIAFNDDWEDKGAGLVTHQADSRLIATLPRTGQYVLRVADAQHRGGAEFNYELRVGAPHPDFELRVVPATINVRPGAPATVTAYVLRRDGFEGEIALGLRDAPRGFALNGARIPAGAEKVQFTLAGPIAPNEEPIALTLVGLAVIDGKTTVHTAVPAEDMMQAFIYHHLVCAQQWLVAVNGRGAGLRGPPRAAPAK